MDYKEMKELAEWLAAKFDGAVTGSIMLKERGIDLGREPGDIDILVREMPNMPADLYKALAGEKDPMPIRYEELSEDGRKRDTWYGRKRRVMINGVKVDFLLADDDRMRKSDMLGKARYADVDGLVKAKEHYLKTSRKPEYADKTERDLAIIYAKMYLKNTPEAIRKRIGRKGIRCATSFDALKVLAVLDMIGERWVDGDRPLDWMTRCPFSLFMGPAGLYYTNTSDNCTPAQDFLDYCYGNLTSASETLSVESILEEASRIVAGERNADYGDPVENFNRIAEAAKALGVDISPVDCCKVLMAVKIARERHCHKHDNLVDLAGYAHILELLENAKK